LSAVDPGAFVERAAIAEFDGGLSRRDAERLAIDEMLEPIRTQRDGILGEIIETTRRRVDLSFTHQAALETLGLMGCRAPAWGFADVVAEGRTYRPAASGEPGRAAVIVAATADGALVDLVAQEIRGGQLRTRLDVAAIVGADEIERVNLTGRPLIVFATLAGWLRGGCCGVVVVDWSRAGAELDGRAQTILAPHSLARRLHDATARCWPRPLVAVPAEARHAA